MIAGVSSSSRATCQNTEVRGGTGDGTVKSEPVRCTVHHFVLGRIIGFEAAVSYTSGEKHYRVRFLTSADSKAQVSAAYSNRHDKDN